MSNIIIIGLLLYFIILFIYYIYIYNIQKGNFDFRPKAPQFFFLHFLKNFFSKKKVSRDLGLNPKFCSKKFFFFAKFFDFF